MSIRIIVLLMLGLLAFTASAFEVTYNVRWGQPNAIQDDIANRKPYWRYRTCVLGVENGCKYINFRDVTNEGQPAGLPYEITMDAEVGQKIVGMVRICVELPEPECSGWSGKAEFVVTEEDIPKEEPLEISIPSRPVITLDFREE